jgi:hypothetical protein
VIVTRDGSRLFLYTATEAHAREAERVVRGLVEADELTAEIAVTRWHPVEESWKDVSIPLPATPEKEEAEWVRGRDLRPQEATVADRPSRARSERRALGAPRGGARRCLRRCTLTSRWCSAIAGDRVFVQTERRPDLRAQRRRNAIESMSPFRQMRHHTAASGEQPASFEEGVRRLRS